jgi:DNA-binding SARP family transcriptional activator
MSVAVIAPSLPAPNSRRIARAGSATVEPMHLALFGGWFLDLAGRSVDLPIAAQRLIAYVALHRGPTRAQVAGTLWAEASELHANGSLRSTLWRVNKARAQLIHDIGGALWLGDHVTVDVTEFSRHARQLIDTASTAEALAMSAARGGELLPGWYDDWVVFERERLRQLRLHALDVLAGALCERARYAEALDVALDALSCEPLRESAHRMVVRIHLAEGNAAEALRAYRECRQLLADELGIAPSPALRHLLVDAGIAATSRDVDEPLTHRSPRSSMLSSPARSPAPA